MVEKLNPFLSSLLMTKRCIFFFGSFSDFFQILEHLQKLRTKTARNAEKRIFRKAVVSFELTEVELFFWVSSNLPKNQQKYFCPSL